ncbi:MAG: isoprenylcysteine carboxylmethyltransferase family protein [Acidobacteriota bacterium]|nr:isoprenylcysteine carboxylmethyltransferase family protein [Acidobacteriota bacterium]
MIFIVGRVRRSRLEICRGISFLQSIRVSGWNLPYPPCVSSFMRILYDWLFPALWIVYVLYWQWMARDVKAATRREGLASHALRSLLMIASVALYFVDVPLRFLNLHFIHTGLGTFWTGAAITAAGLLFSVWARQVLGRNWSREVTVKQDHQLIVRGPYALARHPIYTGLLTAVLGSALAVGRWRALLGAALVFLALGLKLRLEERWMGEQFGAAYAVYRQRVRALIPFVL